MNVDIAVVGIAAERMSPFLKLLVHDIEYDVG
jgi:hypothetical protein